MPSAGQLEAAYATDYVDAEKGNELGDPDVWKVSGEPYRRDIVRALSANGIQGIVLDFGAGWGHLCETLQAAHFPCRGVELSSEMAGYAMRKGLPVRQGGFDAIDARDVSAIAMCAVFEHLTNHHEWMRRFNRILPIGGHVVTLHPTAAFPKLLGTIVRCGIRRLELPELTCFYPPWHTTLISLDAMSIVAERNGFEIVDVRRASQGRLGGLAGFLQRGLEWVNGAGVRLFGLRFPLITSHVFVLRKTSEVSSSETGAGMPEAAASGRVDSRV